MIHFAFSPRGGSRGLFPFSGFAVFTANGKVSVIDKFMSAGTHTVKDFDTTSDALKYVREEIAERAVNSPTPEFFDNDMERVNKYIEVWEEREKARNGVHLFRVFNLWYKEDGRLTCHDFKEVADFECKTLDDVPEKVKEKFGDKIESFSVWLIV